MTNKEFVAMAQHAAEGKSLYIMGCFGAPMNAKNKARYRKNNAYNKQPARQKKIDAATADTFGFDCVGLIKGILWGWNGDVNKTYGGAKYKSNGVPDTTADGMLKKCTDISSDFTVEPAVGEMVWMSGHVGIYIGGWLVIESTPIWKDGVQITACNHTVSGYNKRNWSKHGKLPYVEYIPEPAPQPEPTPEPEIKVGDTVNFTGTKCWSNSQKADDAYAVAKPGLAIVTQIYRLNSAKHPYRLKGAGGEGSAKVSGWCNKEDVHAIVPDPDDVPYAPSVGENIKFIGTKQFTNANQAESKGKAAIPCVAKIKRIYRLGKSKHPYNAHGTGVKGWINADDIRKL